MKALRNFLESLKNGTFFILGEKSTSYQIFRKMDDERSKVYGSGYDKIFHPKKEVIPVTLTNFGKLDICRFILADSAKAPQGFVVPQNVMVKCPGQAMPKPYGQAIYIEDSANGHRVDIKNEERVFILQGIFEFHEIRFLRTVLTV